MICPTNLDFVRDRRSQLSEEEKRKRIERKEDKLFRDEREGLAAEQKKTERLAFAGVEREDT